VSFFVGIIMSSVNKEEVPNVIAPTGSDRNLPNLNRAERIPHPCTYQILGGIMSLLVNNEEAPNVTAPTDSNRSLLIIPM
jgi:hypothetical protein